MGERQNGMEQREITALIAEDDTALLIFIRGLLGKGRREVRIVEVGHTGSASTTVAKAAELQPSVIVLDLHREPPLNRQVVEQMQEAGLKIPVVVILQDDEEEAHWLRRSGVR